MPDSTSQKFKLEPFQDHFIFSQAPHPALVAGWGTGKTMCLIFRGMLYTEEIPNNLGVIFRKQRADLEDSTILDFEKYTGKKINKQSMDYIHPNGSRILFRHIEEIEGTKKRKGENIQNMNLGWYGIEQAEELATDNEFFFLFGRLRRKGNPSKYFKEQGLPNQSGFIIANVYGDNWIKKIWKDNPTKDFDLLEATTYDNAKNLPLEFIKKIEILKERKPEFFNRYCMNDWSTNIEAKVFRGIDKCIAGLLVEPVAGYHYTGGADLAKAKDYFTLFIFCRETNHLVYFKRFRRESWGKVKATIAVVSKLYHEALIVTDSTGVGDPVVEDLERGHVGVDGFHFSNKSKAQIIEKLAIAIENRLITFPNIEILIDELRAFESIVLPSKKIRYQAPGGMTDDCVMGLALAVSELDLYASKRELPQPTQFWGRVKDDVIRSKTERADMTGNEHIYKDVGEEDYERVI